MAESTRFFAM